VSHWTPRFAAAVERLGLAADDPVPYGRDVAKLPLALLQHARVRPGSGRLVLVTAITPTPAGEGKTTTSIGLADALARLGQSVCLALREPSLGPCLGRKGGGTGGGAATLVPAERIDLHFTGDFHAVTSAHNLVAALLDDHLHFGNALGIDPRRVPWRRVLDLDDRALRHVVVGLGGPTDGVPRETGFDITAASEVMAILCLARDADDLRARLARTLVALRRDGAPVTVADLQATGAMLALLHEAVHPNLVTTAEGTPALVHGGPFANVAHGCSSVLGMRLGLHLADWVITAAGFGAALGAEKFAHLVAPAGGLAPAAVVLVATVRALKLHGGRAPATLTEPDPDAVAAGLPNLDAHLDTLVALGMRPIVAVNRFAGDTDAEVAVVLAHAAARGVPAAASTHFVHGGSGALPLAHALLAAAAHRPPPLRPLYAAAAPPREKVLCLARTVYGAQDVVFTAAAERDLATVERLGLGALPVCMAKTNASLSDDPARLGRPQGFDVTVRAVYPNTGAGFLVVLAGDVLRMPGMPKAPRAQQLDVRDGAIVGLY